MDDEQIRNRFIRRKQQRSRTTDVAALGEFVYGEDWRTTVANLTHWDMLLECAAAKYFREAIKRLEDGRRKHGSMPELIELRMNGHDRKIASIHRRRRTWSEHTDREIKSRCVAMLRDIFEEHGITVQLRDDHEGPAFQD
jgi:hypothetical protein